MSGNLLIYGSYGYTGQLIVPLATAAGFKPILAGRSADKAARHADAYNLDHRVFGLEDPKEVDRGLDGISVVLHCAGPFSRTAKPMAAGCIRAKAHYLDITGEIEVFETMAVMGEDAAKAGVMLMPGVGFDVVPSDCLAAHLKRRLPDATELEMAIQAVGNPSRGTATTMVENIHRGGLVRRDGKLTRVPAAWKTMRADFGAGPVSCTSIPWGDVSTAYHSTKIPNITVYMALPAAMKNMALMSRYFRFVLGSRPVQSFLKRQIQSGPPGPSPEERKRGRSNLWGEVRNNSGGRAASILRTPEGYTLTALTAWEIARRSLDGAARPGFQTPSMVFGPDFILEFDGVAREDL